ncbi:MAG: hypothetical protein ACOCSR_01230, partial [Wenzhouxiangella sp.]
VDSQREGLRSVLVAPRPARWRPTRRSVDRDLALQQQIHRMVSRAGAEIDGVLYLDTGLFSRRHRQRDEFEQTAQRYGRKAGEMTLIGSDQALVEAAERSGLNIRIVGQGAVSGARAFDSLKAALAGIRAG